MIRTRMAPSPTGEYHIGHMRTLLFNFAFAKRNDGKFILRVEDTDRNRFVEGATQRILEIIKDYGFSWDEGPDIGGPFEPYTQSQRLDLYKKYALELVQKGYAYYCFCSKDRLEKIKKEYADKGLAPKYDGYCAKIDITEAQGRAKKESFVIRMKIPENEVLEYEDLVMGKISINSAVLDDQVLLKSDGFPTYHLAVVVDDHLMAITHILRGIEWISSTPKHILLYRYFGWEMPKTGHLPVFLDPSGKGKMSKRKGSVSARSFLNEGYLPEAIINFLALLGWSPKDGKEIFSLEEFIKNFDIKDINKSNPAFNVEKLDYFNGHYIRSFSDEDLAKRLVQFDPELASCEPQKLVKIVSLAKERIKTLKEFKELCDFFFVAPRDVPLEFLVPKGRTKKEIGSHIQQVRLDLYGLSVWNLANLKQVEVSVREFAVKNKWKVIDAFSPIRVAISGKLVSPPLFESMEVLGKEETMKRLDNAIKLLA